MFGGDEKASGPHTGRRSFHDRKPEVWSGVCFFCGVQISRRTGVRQEGNGMNRGDAEDAEKGVGSVVSLFRVSMGVARPTGAAHRYYG